MRHLEINAYSIDDAILLLKRTNEDLVHIPLEKFEIKDFSKDEFPLLSLENYIQHSFKGMGAIIKMRDMGYGVSSPYVKLLNDKLLSEEDLIYIEDFDHSNSDTFTPYKMDKMLNSTSKNWAECKVLDSKHELVGKIKDDMRVYHKEPVRISDNHKIHGCLNRYFILLSEEV